MKIAVLGGSPKGDISVTMQYVTYLAQQFPEHQFEVHQVAQRIRAIEQEEGAFNTVLAAVEGADAVLWAFPLYVFLVPAQYKRFIELLNERQADVFRGKPAAILTTSIHFYDHIAHNYIRGIAEDLGMKVLGSYSAAMIDLFETKEQERLKAFALSFFTAVGRDAPVARVNPPLTKSDRVYTPDGDIFTVEPHPLKVMIVSDAGAADSNIKGMVDRLAGYYGDRTEVFNLHDIDIKGGCLGCIRCAYDHSCAYKGKDGFIDFFNHLQQADILILSGTIQDRYLSSRWKTFFDRSFFRTHIPSFTGKQLAYLVSGPFAQLPDLRQIFEAHTELQQANLAGIVTDEAGDPSIIDGLLRELAVGSIEFANAGYVRPPTYLSVGARKLFRDEVWGRMRFPFVADHRYYQASGLYDFPQTDYKTRLRNLFFSMMLMIPHFRRGVYGQSMQDHMVAPFKKLLGRT
ncbi:MAG: NAD(P)H-dependent oxidoreductase [Negativicutes bacterium]|nr:NAD(P)H-dependent oxidoreductase [Negativicutes bacterium]